MLSYAEDETDVEGTVNGVTNTSTGKAAWWHVGNLRPLVACWGFHLRISMEPSETTVERGELRAQNSQVESVTVLLSTAASPSSVLVLDCFLPDSSPVCQELLF